MATIVVSYSHTANNEVFATQLTKKLGARHIRLTESKPRTLGKIALDRIFGRVPKTEGDLSSVGTGDFVVFVGPVWMGQAASPLRHGFRSLASKKPSYAFLSICGGAGPNPGLSEDLTKRMGKAPTYLKELPIVGLLPADPKPTRQMTSGYKITEDQALALSDSVVPALKKHRDRPN